MIKRKKRNKIVNNNVKIFNNITKCIVNEIQYNTLLNQTSNVIKNTDVIDYKSTISCPCGKDTYATRQDAENAMKQRNNCFKYVYKCKQCGHYHLTSNKEKKTKSVKYNNQLQRERNYKPHVISDLFNENENTLRKNITPKYKYINNNTSQDVTNIKQTTKPATFLLKDIFENIK